MKLKILLLEDDPNLGFVLQEHLEANGFAVTLKTNGVEGLAATRETSFALCLVDVMMPKKDGFTFARELRTRDQRTPLVFLTAKSLKEDRVEGFKVGGDDYITKPFSMEELLLRIRAVLRRTSAGTEISEPRVPLTVGKFRFDPGRQTLESARSKSSLTATEAQLLELLVRRRNEVVPRSEILKEIWGDDSYFNGRSLDVFVSRLRKLLARDASLRIINVRGKGYRLSITD
jgi:DNA-binding response OmpR family regulator